MIRIATVADLPNMLGIYAPYVETTTYSFEYAAPTLEQFTTRFEKYTQQCPWLVWEENGRVLGYAYGSLPFQRAAYSWCAEVSIYLAPEIHGQGIGRKLYAVLEEILWRQGYRVIYSLITSENTGSLAFHEKVGYEYCTTLNGCGVKFGRELGVVWMEKRAKTEQLPTTFPLPWTSVVDNDRKWSDILDKLSLF